MNDRRIQEAIQILYMWDTYEPDLARLLQIVKENPEFFATDVKGITPLRQVILKLENIVFDDLMKRISQPAAEGHPTGEAPVETPE